MNVATTGRIAAACTAMLTLLLFITPNAEAQLLGRRGCGILSRIHARHHAACPPIRHVTPACETASDCYAVPPCCCVPCPVTRTCKENCEATYSANEWHVTVPCPEADCRCSLPHLGDSSTAFRCALDSRPTDSAFNITIDGKRLRIYVPDGHAGNQTTTYQINGTNAQLEVQYTGSIDNLLSVTAGTGTTSYPLSLQYNGGLIETDVVDGHMITFGHWSITVFE